MEKAARDAGLPPQHHQLLLAIKGLPEGMDPSVRVLAERMQLAHHSAVELIDRVEKSDYVRRRRDTTDRRTVHIELTPKAEKILTKLGMQSQRQLGRDNGKLLKALADVLPRNKQRRKA